MCGTYYQERCSWDSCKQASNAPTNLYCTREAAAAQGPAGQVIGRGYTKDGGQAYGRKATETWIPPQTPHPRLSRSAFGHPTQFVHAANALLHKMSVTRPACSTLIATWQRQTPLLNEGLCCRNVAGQIAQVQAELQAAQAAAEAAARALEAARAEDREAKQLREQAVRGKQRAERDKNAAESQLDELTSQQPEDADTTNTALQDALKAIFDKDAEMRLLQQKVAALQPCLAWLLSFCCSHECLRQVHTHRLCYGCCLALSVAGCSPCMFTCQRFYTSVR